MIERLRKASPSPWMLLVGIVLCGAIAVSAFIISIVGLRQKIDDSQRESLCRFYAFQINLPQAPTTPRGRASLAQAIEEYRQLGCRPVR